ncbi:MAG: universal stress protein [Hyphomicrobiaceae bacterium]
MIGRHQTKRDVRQERKIELNTVRATRRRRFRILVCVNGTDPSYEGIDLAARIGKDDNCDIILLYVRRIDQGLNSGGLQVRVARQNMLEWGLELPGIQYLGRGRDMLLERGFLGNEWDERIDHTDVFGDPLGDNKVEYRAASGKSIVLKLKTAPDVSSGVLDQYELGPYNLIIMGPPKRWRGELRSFMEPSSVQKVAMLAPGSVLTVRAPIAGNGYLLCTDGSDRSLEAMKRAAVLAHFNGEPVNILSVVSVGSETEALRNKIGQFKRNLTTNGILVNDVDVMVGEPVPAIIEAGKSSSVIVVSDSGKSKFRRFVVGSVAFDVMGAANRSVLNIR